MKDEIHIHFPNLKVAQIGNPFLIPLHIGRTNQCQKILSFRRKGVFIHSDRVFSVRVTFAGWLQKMKDLFEFALHHLHTVSHVIIAKPRSNTSYVYCTVDSELLAVVENVWFVAAPHARMANSRVQSGNEYRTRIQQCCDHPNC